MIKMLIRFFTFWRADDFVVLPRPDGFHLLRIGSMGLRFCCTANPQGLLIDFCLLEEREWRVWRLRLEGDGTTF